MKLDYEAVPYEGRPVAYTAPESLARAAWLEGGPRPSLEAPRVLELGCGDGSNLLALAAHRPRAELLGVDSSERAIADAHEGARALGLSNVRFERGDLARHQLAPPFDFIVAHGVYSWVAAETRAALLERAAELLAPRGLFYVSFNAMPGWGVRARVRDVLRRGPTSLEETRALGRELERVLRESVGASELDPWAALMSAELARATDASDGYLAHEYLSAHNEAFWLGDVARCAERAGLRYVADALSVFPEGRVPGALRARVAELGGDPIEREERVDLLMRRQFRAAVFARADAPCEPALAPGDLDDVFVSGVLRNEREPFEARPGAPERFFTAEGLEVRVEEGLSKMALLTLADRFPDAYSRGALAAEARRHLAAAGFEAPDGELEALSEGLFRLVQHGVLELRLGRPTIRVTPPERPHALTLTRWEAARRDAVTTPLHTSLPLDPVDRALVAQLDGTRDAAAAAASLLAAIERGELTLEGAPSSPYRLRPELEARAQRVTTLLGWWGLLE